MTTRKLKVEIGGISSGAKHIRKSGCKAYGWPSWDFQPEAALRLFQWRKGKSR